VLSDDERSELAMTTRELLIREINRAPEDVLQQTLHYLQQELGKRRPALDKQRPQTTGPYADYWNQFIGAFADEEWERPAQGTLETREAW
jgi:hypothetical protein